MVPPAPGTFSTTTLAARDSVSAGGEQAGQRIGRRAGGKRHHQADRLPG